MAPVSKTQMRILKIAGLAVSDDYDTCAQRLDAAGYPRSGLPAGVTWRAAAKMTDAELIAACGATVAEIADRREGEALRAEMY